MGALRAPLAGSPAIVFVSIYFEFKLRNETQKNPAPASDPASAPAPDPAPAPGRTRPGFRKVFRTGVNRGGQDFRTVRFR